MKNTYIQMVLEQDYHRELFLTSVVMLWISAILIIVSVALKFVEHNSNKKLKKKVKQNHFVETFSMTFIIFIIAVMMQKEQFFIKTDFITHLLNVIWGGVFVIIATVIHIWSKVNIGKFWSNQIEIKKKHKIVTNGVYSIVRHPMYSSIILWLIALNIMFMSCLGTLLTAIVFVPIMILRARAEDQQLEKLDKASFKVFKSNVKMLVPRFDKYTSLFLRLLGIAILGYSIVMSQMTLDRVLSLFVLHIMIGLMGHQANVRFSYRNKSFFLLIFFGITSLLPAAYFLYYVVLIFNVYGLFFNCPCMLVYNKYQRCPCWGWMKSCKMKK